MPITINDCVECGATPLVCPEGRTDALVITCITPDCHQTAVCRADFGFLARDWNKLNPVSPDDTAKI